MNDAYLRSVTLKEDPAPDFRSYPFSIPAIGKLGVLRLDAPVTFLIGENGSGKSTLIEAIAVALGFNAEGGSKNFNFSSRATHSELHRHLRLVKGAAFPRDGFFLRAESLYNVASQIDELGVNPDNYGGKSLHHQSHGESFMALILNRFRGGGLYLLDEPEAALSPARQLACLRAIHELVKRRSQFVIATHSPILLAFPGAVIYQLSEDGVEAVEYEQTDHYQITRRFLERREEMLHELMEDE